MHITWHGQYTVKLQTNNTTIVIDPHGPDAGLGGFRGKTDVVALTNPQDPDMSHVSGIQGEPLVIENPGEYSTLDYTLTAIGWHDDADNERSLQRWVIGKITLLYVGALTRKLTDEELGALEKTDIDILFVPVGGGSGLTADEAVKLTTTIEPRIVIPIHYKIPKVKENIEDVRHFAEEFGANPMETENKFVAKANKLPQDDMEVVILKT